MDMAWFIYTVALMVLVVIACSVSVTVWVLTSNKMWAFSAIGFALYTLELSIIFYSEYIGDKPFMEAYFNQGLQWPFITLPLNIALLTFVRIVTRYRVHAPIDKRVVLLFVVVYGSVSCMVAPVGNLTGTIRNMLYWGWRDLSFMFSLWCVYYRYRWRATENERADIARSKRLYLVLVALSVVMLCEDIFFICLFRFDMEQGSALYEFFWHFTERNITENVIVIILAVRQIRHAKNVMSVFSNHPAEGGSQQGPSLEADVEMRLPRFGDAYEMSPREREVLRLLLLQKSTNEIASELFISQGTVKAHLHRIYTKVGTKNRQDLITAFWKY